MKNAAVEIRLKAQGRILTFVAAILLVVTLGGFDLNAITDDDRRGFQLEALRVDPYGEEPRVWTELGMLGLPSRQTPNGEEETNIIRKSQS